MTIVVLLLITLLAPGVGCTAGNGDPLPPGGGEPGKALMAFLEAAHNKDFAKIRDMYPAEEAKKVTDMELEQALGMFILFDPATLSITGGSAKGDAAILDTLSHGTISMRRTNGKWLMTEWKARAEATVDMQINAEITFNPGADTPSGMAATPPQESAESAGAREAKDVPSTITFAFDPRTLKVLPEDEQGGQVMVVTGDGEEKMLFHHAGSHEEAANAAAILKFYGVNEVLAVSMPGVVENIYLKSGQVPSGNYQNEQCTAFDPAALAVTEFTGTYRSETGQEVTYTQWSVASGKQTVVRYNEKPFAEEMASILRKYGCNTRCHKGGFWYFRK